MMFIRAFVFFVGLLALFLLAWVGIVGVPALQIYRLEAPSQLERYTFPQDRGRRDYICEGCIHCHSQQVRPEGFGADQARRWGRPSVPADYVYDFPHLLGTMRTGPDLFNIGARQSSEDWHLLHLYNPRALVPGSIMPPYSWLFEVKDSVGPEERLVKAPAPHGPPEDKVVVAAQDALDLIAYLPSLNHTYPVK